MTRIPLSFCLYAAGFLSILLTTFTSLAQVSESNPVEENQFTVYGFGRTNLVWDDRDMKRSDLFVPANIQVGASKNPNFFIGAKQTRLGLDVKHKFGEETLSIKIEGDFHNDVSDATGLLRMRLAYAEYKFVSVGMNWSNFYDIEANPITVDFEGPNSSTFSRTPQFRFFTYKKKNVLSVSLENPIENVTVGSGVTVLPERFPDVVGAYRINGAFGFIKMAALVREIRYETDQPRGLPGYGLTILGSVKVGANDKLRFQFVTGTGVARYIQGASDLNYDAVYNGTNELETLQMHGSFASFQHFWTAHSYSSVTAGWLGVNDNVNLVDTNYKYGYYASVNYFWQPAKNLTFGAEALFGERKNMNNEKGEATRIQMSVTYNFSKNI